MPSCCMTYFLISHDFKLSASDLLLLRATAFPILLRVYGSIGEIYLHMYNYNVKGNVMIIENNYSKYINSTTRIILPIIS